VCGIVISRADQPDYHLGVVVYRPHYADSPLARVWVPGEDAEAMAVRLGRRWPHGLIHLGRAVPGGRDVQYRLDAWTPSERTVPSDWAPYPTPTQEDQLSDDALQVALLQALRRMHRTQANTSQILHLDTQGIADVLRVPLARVREALGDLLAEGLVEPYLEAMGGNDARSGRCRITGAGLRRLRELERPTTATHAPVTQAQTIHVHGGSVNVAQTGAGSITQTTTAPGTVAAVAQLLAELRDAIQGLDAPEDERAELLEPVTRLRAELQQPTPRVARLQTAWGAVRVIGDLESAWQGWERVQKIVGMLAPLVPPLLTEIVKAAR
jgi:hypothetical protein